MKKICTALVTEKEGLKLIKLAKKIKLADQLPANHIAFLYDPYNEGKQLKLYNEILSAVDTGELKAAT